MHRSGNLRQGVPGKEGREDSGHQGSEKGNYLEIAARGSHLAGENFTS